MRKKAFILFITCLIFTQVALSQINEADRVRITRVYEEAEKLYRVGSYAASIDYLKREGGVLLNTSDSLQYLKIKNLENIYRTDHGLTIELESSLKLFFGKVNKYSFPELKYDEVTAIYTRFSGFKERDKAFYDSVSRAFDLNKEVSLVSVRNITSDYLKINPNTYYSKELNDYVSSINNKLSELESKRRRLALDSTFHDRLKMVGKRLTMNLSYSVPSGSSSFTGLHNYNEAEKFYNGKYAGGLGEKYIVGASLGDALINIYSGTRAKLALSWSIFDAEYTEFDWATNTFLFDKETDGTVIENIQSIKAGTRLGPMVAVMLTKRIAVAIYYSTRPGVQFLMHSSYFSETNGTTTTQYTIKPVIASFNLSNEVGLRFYFFERLFVSPYFHFGNYTWQNDINSKSASGSNTSVRTTANYKFNYVGLRIGF